MLKKIYCNAGRLYNQNICNRKFNISNTTKHELVKVNFDRYNFYLITFKYVVAENKFN